MGNFCGMRRHPLLRYGVWYVGDAAHRAHAESANGECLDGGRTRLARNRSPTTIPLSDPARVALNDQTARNYLIGRPMRPPYLTDAEAPTNYPK